MVLLVLAFVIGFLTFVSPVLATNALINEFMAHPSTGNSEWVEFYNPDNLDLTSFWIDDDTSFTSDAGSSAKKSLSTITNSIYPTIDLSSVLNNSGDYVVLFSNDGTIIDQYQYTQDPEADITLGRNPDGGSWTTLSTVTKGSSNGSISSPSPSTFPSPSSSSSTNSSFTISNIPEEINSDQAFSVHVFVSLPNNSNTTYYLKAAFKKSDSSNYFGETKVGGIWVKNGSSYSEQVKITTDSNGNWSGDIEVKPDILDSGYDGAGKYIFKVGKYSSSGALTWSDEKNIQIAAKEVSLDDTKEMPETKVTGNSNAKLPDSVYSLENYRKSATVAGAKTENSPPSKVSVAGQEFKSPFIFLGFGFLGLGLVIIGYIIFRRWKAT